MYSARFLEDLVYVLLGVVVDLAVLGRVAGASVVRMSRPPSAAPFRAPKMRHPGGALDAHVEAAEGAHAGLAVLIWSSAATKYFGR